MSSTALHWNVPELQRQLGQRLAGLVVEVAPQLGSSNTVLIDRFRSRPDAPPCLLVAEQQTAGRGRQGKRWLSEAGASLTFSLGLPLAPAEWSGLSLAVGLALADALDPQQPGQPPRIGIKWPNDLLLVEFLPPDGDAAGAPASATALPGRKLGGILIETVQSAKQRLAVIGIGLNIAPLPAMALADAELPWGHACLRELTPAADAPAVLARIGAPLLQALQDFERDGFAPLQSAFARRDLLAGRRLASAVSGAIQGIGDGVDERGVLWLAAGGRRFPVSSGDIRLLAETGVDGIDDAR